MRIQPARTQAEIEEARKLFREYEAFLGIDLCFQSFEEELASLPGRYAPPGGELLIAVDSGVGDGKIVGCVALRKLEDGICEMKRLFVKPEARGSGVGRGLARKIITAARELGYSRMRLDTLDRLTEALCLYTSLGFRAIEPYYKNPIPGVVYMELFLGSDDRSEKRPG
jgi:ribosomal protein S18 acetylase RimI-like enzyme